MRMPHIILILVSLAVASENGEGQKLCSESVTICRQLIQNDILSDSTVAVQVAEAILIPIYGKQKIEQEKPFSAKSEGKTWVVTGSLPKGWNGGVAQLVLLKSNGRVISLCHGK